MKSFLLAFKSILILLTILDVVKSDKGASPLIEIAARVNTPGYSYLPEDPNGPQNWKNLYPTCGGRQQSPIDVITKTAKKSGSSSFHIKGYSELPQSITSYNTGGSFGIQLNFNTSTEVYFEGGPLDSKYTVDSIHWHWGNENANTGSEHAINGKKGAAEAHIVAYNSKYGSINASISRSDGFAVICILYEVRNQSDFNLSFKF